MPSLTIIFEKDGKNNISNKNKLKWNSILNWLVNAQRNLTFYIKSIIQIQKKFVRKIK